MHILKQFLYILSSYLIVDIQVTDSNNLFIVSNGTVWIQNCSVQQPVYDGLFSNRLWPADKRHAGWAESSNVGTNRRRSQN